MFGGLESRSRVGLEHHAHLRVFLLNMKSLNGSVHSPPTLNDPGINRVGPNVIRMLAATYTPIEPF